MDVLICEHTQQNGLVGLLSRFLRPRWVKRWAMWAMMCEGLGEWDEFMKHIGVVVVINIIVCIVFVIIIAIAIIHILFCSLIMLISRIILLALMLLTLTQWGVDTGGRAIFILNQHIKLTIIIIICITTILIILLCICWDT